MTLDRTRARTTAGRAILAAAAGATVAASLLAGAPTAHAGSPTPPPPPNGGAVYQQYGNGIDICFCSAFPYGETPEAQGLSSTSWWVGDPYSYNTVPAAQLPDVWLSESSKGSISPLAADPNLKGLVFRSMCMLLTPQADDVLSHDTKTASTRDITTFPVLATLSVTEGQPTIAYETSALDPGQDTAEFFVTGLVLQPSLLQALAPCIDAGGNADESCVADVLGTNCVEGGAGIWDPIRSCFAGTGQRVIVTRRSVAVADTAVSDQGRPVTIDVVANDTLAVAGQGALTAVGAPAHGTATIVGGKVVYTPRPGYSGTDTFTYTLTDAKTGAKTTGSVTVTAAPTPTPTPTLTRTPTPTLTPSVAQTSVSVAPTTTRPAPSSSSSSRSASATPPPSALADTGAPDLAPVGLGALLVGLGAVLTGRRSR